MSEVIGLLLFLGCCYAAYKYITREKPPRSGSGGSGGGSNDGTNPRPK